MKPAGRVMFLASAAGGILVCASEGGCAGVPDIVFVDDGGLVQVTEDGAALDASAGNLPPSGSPDDDAETKPSADASTSPLPPSPRGGSDDAGSSSGGPNGGGSSSSGVASSGSSSGGMPGPGAGSGGMPGPGPSCPSHPPPGADACCGTIACVGMHCAQSCPECLGCIASPFCCAPNGNGQAVTCAATAPACAMKHP